MSDVRRFKGLATRSIAFLVIIVALSAATMKISQGLVNRASVRSQRLAEAAFYGSQGQRMESGREAETSEFMRSWAASMARYYRAMEAKYANAAAEPWTPMTPDPPPPILPTQAQFEAGAETPNL